MNAVVKDIQHLQDRKSEWVGPEWRMSAEYPDLLIAVGRFDSQELLVKGWALVKMEQDVDALPRLDIPHALPESFIDDQVSFDSRYAPTPRDIFGTGGNEPDGLHLNGHHGLLFALAISKPAPPPACYSSFFSQG